MLLFSQGMQLPTITTFPQNNKAWINWKDLWPQETLHRSKVIMRSGTASSQFYHNLKISALLLKSQILKTCNWVQISVCLIYVSSSCGLGESYIYDLSLSKKRNNLYTMPFFFFNKRKFILWRLTVGSTLDSWLPMSLPTEITTVHFQNTCKNPQSSQALPTLSDTHFILKLR